KTSAPISSLGMPAAAMASITSGPRISCSSVWSGASCGICSLPLGLAAAPTIATPRVMRQSPGPSTCRGPAARGRPPPAGSGSRALGADLAFEGNDALVALAGAALVGHRHDDLERVAVLDRLVDAPAIDAEHGDDGAVVDAGLAHQATGDRQDQRSVGDRLAVGLLFAELPIDVRCVEVPGKTGEVDDIRVRDG